ncbi:hypothetical protein GUJ93_ZPchr0002g26290 [Zizania palustris]|uniref:Uncharacterized protein n=1 Tax=Zizania palustris TaxID=103762 RepID=A0A8J5RCV6_ZIZPA|nr:hypothetical protein GUJ93_ZPchr0002g26290 [Zizania palustris]
MNRLRLREVLKRVLAEGTNEHDDNVYQVSKCSPQCAYRCSQTQYKKPCLFFCNKRCNACLCVPSGLYGNKGECPCYSNRKTKRGGPKCP